MLELTELEFTELEVTEPSVNITEEGNIFILSPKKLSASELQELAYQAGVRSVGTNGHMVLESPEVATLAPGVAASGRILVYEYVGHIGVGPQECKDLWKCRRYHVVVIFA